MSVYKRKGSPHWQIAFSLKGRRVQRSSGTSSRQEAEVIEARLKQDIWDQITHGKRPPVTLREAGLRWIEEKAHEKRTISRDARRLKRLCESLGNRQLETIERKDVIKVITEKRKLAPSTINSHLALVAAIQNIACQEWQITTQRSRIRLLPVDNERVRWITPEEADKVIQILPDRFKDPARLALATGLRKHNVLKMEWGWVNLVNRTVTIPAAHFKGKRTFTCILNQDAVDIIRRQIGKNTRYVFGTDGQPLARMRWERWDELMEKIGLEDFHWHDLRHTWASWHVQLGTSLQELKELGGWQDLKMVMRYAHLSPQQKRSAAERVVTKSLTPLNHADEHSAETQAECGLQEA